MAQQKGSIEQIRLAPRFASQMSDSDSCSVRLRLIRGLSLGVVFLGAWAGMSLIAGKMLPFPNVPEVSEKFRYFDAHKDGFDTIFVGSSRTYYQIIPRKFDAECEEAGVRTNSFNLANAGMWPPESFYFLRQILRLRPAHLKFVMIDLMDMDSRGDRGTQRAVYWHDWSHTVMAMRDVMESPLTLSNKITQLREHGALFLKRLSNPGSAVEWLGERMIPSKHPYPPRWAGLGGFEPLVESGLTGERREKYLNVVSSFKAGLPRKPARAVFFDACNEIAEEVQRTGAEPIFILAPTTGTGENRFRLPDGITVFDFNDPAQYPILFDADLRYDEWHLNEKGAIAYTHLIAQHFVMWQRRRLSRN